MENQKKARKENRKPEEIRETLEAAMAKHYQHIEKIKKRIAELDEAKKEKKISMSNVLKIAKDDFSPEEMLAILEAAKRKKHEMGAE